MRRETSSSTAYVSQRLSHAGDGQVEAPLPRDRCIGSPRRSQYHGCRMSEVYQLWIALDLKVKDYCKTRLTTLATAPIIPTIGLPKNRRSPVYCPTLTRLTIAPSIHLACAALRARLNVQIADGLDWLINMRPEHLLDGVQRRWFVAFETADNFSPPVLDDE